jgi:hypothetical protein
MSGATSTRFMVSSVNTSTGFVSVQVLPPAFGNGVDVQAINQTTYYVSFAVTMSSVSQANATALIAAAGIPYAEVSVMGRYVTFAACNITVEMLSSLRSNALVQAGSVTTPGIALGFA